MELIEEAHLQSSGSSPLLSARHSSFRLPLLGALSPSLNTLLSDVSLVSFSQFFPVISRNRYLPSSSLSSTVRDMRQTG
jgi:hypothetical protein